MKDTQEYILQGLTMYMSHQEFTNSLRIWYNGTLNEQTDTDILDIYAHRIPLYDVFIEVAKVWMLESDLVTD